MRARWAVAILRFKAFFGVFWRPSNPPGRHCLESVLPVPIRWLLRGPRLRPVFPFNKTRRSGRPTGPQRRTALSWWARKTRLLSRRRLAIVFIGLFILSTERHFFSTWISE